MLRIKQHEMRLRDGKAILQSVYSSTSLSLRSQWHFFDPEIQHLWEGHSPKCIFFYSVSLRSQWHFFFGPRNLALTPWHLLAYVVISTKCLRSQSWLFLSSYIHSLGEFIKTQGFKYICIPMTVQCCLQPGPLL